MTAAPFPPPITCPSSLIASCAPLLGFTPDNCLVCLIHGAPGRTSPVILRVDLPTPEHAQDVAVSTTTSILGTGGVALDAVAWVQAPDDALRHDLPSSMFLEELGAELAMAGIELGATLTTNGRVWWSHVCSDPSCCPARGTRLDGPAMDAIRAEYVFAGYAPLASRAELAQRVSRDEVRAATVDSALRRTSPPRTSRWRGTQINFLTGLLLARDACEVDRRPLTSTRTARVLRGLADIQVRDVVLRRMAVSDRACHRCWEATIEVLCETLRSAPAGHTAPVATVLGLVAWMRGQGALATLSLQRADEEPGYRLADLAAELMRRGTDPRLWRASLGELSEAECRNPGAQ